MRPLTLLLMASAHVLFGSFFEAFSFDSWSLTYADWELSWVYFWQLETAHRNSRSRSRTLLAKHLIFFLIVKSFGNWDFASLAARQDCFCSFEPVLVSDIPKWFFRLGNDRSICNPRRKAQFIDFDICSRNVWWKRLLPMILLRGVLLKDLLELVRFYFGVHFHIFADLYVFTARSFVPIFLRGDIFHLAGRVFYRAPISTGFRNCNATGMVVQRIKHEFLKLLLF